MLKMKTKEELLGMSHEELAEYAAIQQSKACSYDYVTSQKIRLKEILAAIGIAYETYKREIL